MSAGSNMRRFPPVMMVAVGLWAVAGFLLLAKSGPQVLSEWQTNKFLAFVWLVIVGVGIVYLNAAIEIGRGRAKHLAGSISGAFAMGAFLLSIVLDLYDWLGVFGLKLVPSDPLLWGCLVAFIVGAVCASLSLKDWVAWQQYSADTRANRP